MESSNNILGILDYLVFAGVLLTSSAIGLHFRFSGGKQKTFKEYLFADQNMSMVPVAFSLMASFMSAITLLGVSNENYTYGSQFILINFSYIISTPICCYFYLPVFFRLQKMSVYEYLQYRFGRATRLSASLAFTFQMTLYMGVVLFAPALALSAVTGLSQTWSIIAIGTICTFYSSIGGMKAVLITDVFQALLMFIAIFTVLTQGVLDFGFQKIFKDAQESGRLEFFNFSLDPRIRHTVWSLSIGGIINYCSLYGVNQTQVQRLLTIKSLSNARKSLWIQWIILTFLSLSTSFSGLVLYSFFKGCDPKMDGKISNSDQILPFYVVERLGSIPGLTGLFISGVFSGSLSSVSSSLNSLAAVTLHDYIMPLFPIVDYYGETKSAAIGKFIAMLYGIICIAVAFMAQLLGTSVLQVSLTIFGAVGGPLLALFTLGMTFRSVNQKGCLTGLAFGLVISLWISFGTPKTALVSKSLTAENCSSFITTFGLGDLPLTNISRIVNYQNDSYINEDISTAGTQGKGVLQDFYSISYMWVGLIGFLTTSFVGLIGSYLDGGQKSPINPALLSHWVWSDMDKEIMMRQNGGMEQMIEVVDAQDLKAELAPAPIIES